MSILGVNYVFCMKMIVFLINLSVYGVEMIGKNLNYNIFNFIYFLWLRYVNIIYKYFFICNKKFERNSYNIYEINWFLLLLKKIIIILCIFLLLFFNNKY